MRKIAFLDVESTSLTADSGFIVGAGILWEDDEWEHIFVKKNIVKEERIILEKILERLDRAETIITWYGENFDYPMIISRSLVNGLNPTKMLTKRHIDLYMTCKKLLRLSNYTLDSTAKFFKINKKTELKGSDMPPYYMKAISGDEEAYRRIIEHCYDDLKALKQIYYIMKDIVGYINPQG